MEKEITDTIFNLEDRQFYVREYDSNNNLFGRKIVVYDNKIITEKKSRPIKATDTVIRPVFEQNYLDVGDVLFINNSEYICLYYDKLKTILFERQTENKVDNVFQIPSRDIYLKVGTASLDELKTIYERFLMFRGMFKGICLDAIEGTMKRLLEE